jgi:hypothetical protein
VIQIQKQVSKLKCKCKVHFRFEKETISMKWAGLIHYMAFAVDGINWDWDSDECRCRLYTFTLLKVKDSTSIWTSDVRLFNLTGKHTVIGSLLHFFEIWDASIVIG